MSRVEQGQGALRGLRVSTGREPEKGNWRSIPSALHPPLLLQELSILLSATTILTNTPRDLTRQSESLWQQARLLCVCVRGTGTPSQDTTLHALSPRPPPFTLYYQMAALLFSCLLYVSMFVVLFTVCCVVQSAGCCTQLQQGRGTLFLVVIITCLSTAVVSPLSALLVVCFHLSAYLAGHPSLLSLCTYTSHRV